MSFKKTLVILFVAFFALWSLVHLSAVYFFKLVNWIWKGTTIAQNEKLRSGIKKDLEQPLIEIRQGGHKNGHIY